MRPRSHVCADGVWRGLGPNPRSLAERFQTKFDLDHNGCWLWKGSLNFGGYGFMYLGVRDGKKRKIAAHRASWQIHNGEIPCGMMVLHRCDVRRCVNPSHLFLGTQDDNMRDMAVKNRSARKLNPDAVRAIVQDARPPKDIAKVFGVTPRAIELIKMGRTWKHLTGIVIGNAEPAEFAETE